MSLHEKTEGLVRRALGDPEAFAALVEKVRPRLETWLTLRMGELLRSRVAVEDALQETLIQAYRSLGEFRDQGDGSFRRWILSIAENRLKDLHKYHAAQRRDPRREAHPRNESEARLLLSLSASGRSPSSVAHGRDLARRVTEAMGRMEEPMRELILQRLVEERSFADMARSLGREVSAVRGEFVRAMFALREELEGQAGGTLPGPRG